MFTFIELFIVTCVIYLMVSFGAANVLSVMKEHEDISSIKVKFNISPSVCSEILLKARSLTST